jgi:hypothetical protein
VQAFATVPAPIPQLQRVPATSYRGTRLLAGSILTFAGLVLLAFGGIATPIAASLSDTPDAGLLSTLVTLAPFVVVAALLHVVAAVGVFRDRDWGYRLAIWMIALAVFVILAGIVMALAGRDPFAVASTDPKATGDGLGILLWTLAWYGVAAWAIQRVLVGRSPRIAR